jgi:hypothetical protein
MTEEYRWKIDGGPCDCFYRFRDDALIEAAKRDHASILRLDWRKLRAPSFFLNSLLIWGHGISTVSTDLSSTLQGDGTNSSLMQRYTRGQSLTLVSCGCANAIWHTSPSHVRCIRFEILSNFVAQQLPPPLKWKSLLRPRGIFTSVLPGIIPNYNSTNYLNYHKSENWHASTLFTKSHSWLYRFVSMSFVLVLFALFPLQGSTARIHNFPLG